ncbi:unnamed protein product [Hyaloperonospora brassicae]|uniref:Transcription elongation factor Eaf N-terminal domain-containing protein n=1 Tax=Hyaloperonospora brassicae TaxID=162125 RepID=A0AAV0U3E9_HYABA|nr:unnamed protein product [Hyaloperonospora brassicae]
MSRAPTPLDDHEYPVALGESLVEPIDDGPSRQQSSDEVFASFGYEFQPASVDKRTPGLVCVDASSSVQVLMGSSTGAAGGVSFRGKVLEHKETDCLLLFDGSRFRLERCRFSCMQLRHVRVSASRRRGTCQRDEEKSNGKTSTTTITATGTGASAGAETAPMSKHEGTCVASTTAMPAATAKRPVRRSQRRVSAGQANASDAVKQPRSRPKRSLKVATAAAPGKKTRKRDVGRGK